MPFVHNLFDDPNFKINKKIRYLKSAQSLAKMFVELFENGQVGPNKKVIASWLSKNFLFNGRKRTESYFYKLLEPTSKTEAMSKVPKSALRLKDSIDIRHFLS
jgi:hypothetical protein